MNNTFLAINIGSSNITAVTAKHDTENNINILGTGVQKSSGINKGLIINIEEATQLMPQCYPPKNPTRSPIHLITTIITTSNNFRTTITTT